MFVSTGALLFFIMSALLGAIAILLYDSYRKSSNTAVRSLFMGFSFIFLYSLLLALAFVIGESNKFLVVIIFNLSVLSAFTAMYFGLKLPILSACPSLEDNFKLVSRMLILVAAIVLVIQILDPRLPDISSTGIIFWNLNPVAGWIISLFCLVYSLIWAYLAYSNAKSLGDFQLKFKLYVLSLNIAIVGLSAFLFFLSSSELVSLISFLIVIPCHLLTIGTFSYFRLSRARAA